MTSRAPIPFARDRTDASLGAGPGVGVTQHSALAHTGDAFVFLDLPPGAHVGCDTLVGTTNKESTPPQENPDATTGCCGFRDIPPGTHFAWISAPGALSRQGCWFTTKPAPGGTASRTAQGTVRIKQWERFHEVLVDFRYPDQGASATHDMATAYSHLIPYSVGSVHTAPSTSPQGQGRHGGVDSDIELWRQLTSCVTEAVLGRIAGSPISTAPAHPSEWLYTTTDTSRDEVAMLGGGSHKNTDDAADTGAAYSEFSFLFAKDDLDAYRLLATQEKKHPENHKQHDPSDEKDSAPSDSTDTTQRLLALLEHPQSHITEADIIGELQFAFLTGIVLSNLSCLEQWWHFILRVFLRARHLVARRPTLCRAFLIALHTQLTYLERFTPSKIARLSPRTGLASDSSNSNGDGNGNGSTADTGTSIFDAKPQGAVRLRASLAVFRRQFKFSNSDSKTTSQDAAQVDEKSILSTPLAEASAAEAFMDLEALLWKYGWDLSGSRDDDTGDQDAGKRNDYSQDDDDDDDEVEIYDTPLKEGAQVGTRHAKIQSALSDSDDDDDDDDYQPVVVEMDDDGREVGLVSWN